MNTVNKFSISKALVFIKKDINDDFWPDILSYEDYFGKDIFTAENFRSYVPAPVSILNIPKPTLILRPGHFMRFTDRIYYQILVDSFAKNIDRKLLNKNVVFSHRVSDKNGYFFDKAIDAWKRFNKKTEDLFLEYPEGCLLKTDISAYFEHIRIRELIKTLSILGVKKEVTNQLSTILNTWHEEIGIPQGNDASSFLGNVYLHPIDDAMINAGFIYYRYMDDIRVFAKDEKTVREALAKITELFRPLNLHLAGGKTKIMKIDGYLSQSNKFAQKMDEINYSIETNIEDFDETLVELKKMWKIGIKKNDKTLINFCIFRFKKLNSDTPLDQILKLNLLDPSFSPIIFSYLENYINKKRVQEVLLKVLQDTPYHYQKIFILKTLIKANKIFFNLNIINKENVYNSHNFLLIGYYFVLVGKFGTIGQRADMKIDYYNNYCDDDKISRYFLVALKYFDKTGSDINKLIRTKPVLKKTLNYLNQNNWMFNI